MLPLGVLILMGVCPQRMDVRRSHVRLEDTAKVPGLPDGMAATFINYGSFQGLSLFFSLYHSGRCSA